MDAVFRSLGLYLLLLIVFRIAGRRSFSEMTTFDFVLLLVIGGATKRALLGDDFSVTDAFAVIATLITVDVGFSLAARRFHWLNKAVEGTAMIVVEDGRLLRERLRRARIGENEVLSAARNTRGLERLDQIKFAVLETNGKISVIPKDEYR